MLLKRCAKHGYLRDPDYESSYQSLATMMAEAPSYPSEQVILTIGSGSLGRLESPRVDDDTKFGPIYSRTFHELVFRLAERLHHYGRCVWTNFQRRSSGDRSGFYFNGIDVFQNFQPPRFDSAAIRAAIELESMNALALQRGRHTPTPSAATVEAVRVVPSPARENDDRDRWIYEQRSRGVPLKMVRKKLSEEHPNWEPLHSDPGVSKACSNWAKRNGLPLTKNA